MSEDVPMQHVVVTDPDLQELAADATKAARTTSTTLFVSDITDDNKLLEEIVVKFGVESVSNPTQRALRWDEITKTFNSLSLTLSGKTMTKDQVRRKWNNMKKITRKKWESDDPSSHQREPLNLENSATFEIIRQEEDTVEGSTTTTIVVVDQTEKQKQQSSEFGSKNVLPLGIETKAEEKESEDEEEPSQGGVVGGVVGGDEDDEDKLRRQRKRKMEQHEDAIFYKQIEESFGPLDEMMAKKRLRWEKRLRNAETSFQRKKLEIEAKIKEYQTDLNQMMRINNDLQQKILDKKMDLELVEEEVTKLDEILQKPGALVEMYP